MTSTRWSHYFLDLALTTARMSKDPSTKVGAVLVNEDNIILATGFNGFPRGVQDIPERYADRDMKLKLVVHAEMNAILAAARLGTRLKGSTLYLAATDNTHVVWGGCPCTRCTVEMIQAGIVKVVTHPMKSGFTRWREDIELARGLLEEVGIGYEEVVS